jgi:thioredoxin-like negative regulator of GroEL
MEILKLLTPSKDENFNQTDYDTNLKKINSGIHNHPSMVSMVAPWCPHCQNLEPILDSLENELNNDSHFNKLKMIRINDEFLNDVSTELEPQSFPTISFFINGQKIDNFSGTRNLPELKNYVMNHLKNIMKHSKNKPSKRINFVEHLNKSKNSQSSKQSDLIQYPKTKKSKKSKKSKKTKKNKKKKKKTQILKETLNNRKKLSIYKYLSKLSKKKNKKTKKLKKKSKQSKSIKEMINNL